MRILLQEDCKMFIGLPSVSVILIVLMSTAALVQGCRNGWFGYGCSFQCHCSGSTKCGINGECPDNSPCESPYFGTGCQYVDMLVSDVAPETPLYLRDYNDSTCNTNTKARSVQLFLRKSLPLTWYRIVVNNNRNLLNITTRFNDRVSCRRENVYAVNNQSVDVWCHTNIFVSSITISGGVVGSLCTVQVSGGRNVALKQRASQSSNYHNYHISRVRASNAVDGNTNPNDRKYSCSRTDDESTSPHWNLTFNQSYWIPRILIYISDGVCAVKGPRHECPKGRYGDECNSTCSPSCQYKCHSESGLCFTCKPGFSGSNCEDACSPGTFGPACQLTCSPKCFSVCSSTDGTCLCKDGFHGPMCTECMRGMYGENCTNTCSDLCTERGCHMLTGECLHCDVKRVGRFCEGCSEGFYGNTCALECPNFCESRDCNISTGHCYSCQTGYQGAFCSEGATVQHMHPALPFIVVVPFLLMAVCLFICQGRSRRLITSVE